jgi:preprotein translocase subunit SecA
VLVGTISVEKSEVVSQLLKKKSIPHNVLNAKFHEMEAQIVAQAGRKGAVTISTNMAGRGTDIVLGGNYEAMAKAEASPDAEPEKYAELLATYKKQCLAERDEVLAAGGLHILGTERHESRRIDNQLRGRSGRQGDPGSSRFYLSLQDDLLRIFGAERITGIMERLGMEEDVPIEHPWVNRAIENAQRKVEGHNFDIRKSLLEYDDVMNQQRKTIYALRRQVLEGRYQPELSEADKKAGKTAEAPTKSGDWTGDKLAVELRPQVELLLDQFFTPAEAPHRAPGEIAGEPPPEQPKKTWRQLRHLVWRRYGSLVDVERPFERAEVAGSDERKALVELIVNTVAASMIQQRERIFDLSSGLIDAALDEACPANVRPDEWDRDKLGASLREIFNTKVEFDDRTEDADALAKEVWGHVEALLKKREDELTTQAFLHFARYFFLQEIDGQWIDHLKAMDHLREGIHLRGYGQKDPKQEYKKEGFSLFGEMMTNIQRNVGQNLFRVQVQREEGAAPPPAALPEFAQKPRKMVAFHPGEGQAAAPSGSAGGAAAVAKAASPPPEKQQTVRRTEPKVGRNDPCPCGSGKKYKKCHGAGGESSTEA